MLSASLYVVCVKMGYVFWGKEKENVNISVSFGYKTYWCFACVLTILQCLHYLDFLPTAKPKDLTVLFLHYEPSLLLSEEVWWYCSILHEETEAGITKSHTAWLQRKGTKLRAFGLHAGHICFWMKTRQELVLQLYSSGFYQFYLFLVEQEVTGSN